MGDRTWLGQQQSYGRVHGDRRRISNASFFVYDDVSEILPHGQVGPRPGRMEMQSAITNARRDICVSNFQVKCISSSLRLALFVIFTLNWILLENNNPAERNG